VTVASLDEAVFPFEDVEASAIGGASDKRRSVVDKAPSTTPSTTTTGSR